LARAEEAFGFGDRPFARLWVQYAAEADHDQGD
jgi:hypothetical protein